MAVAAEPGMLTGSSKWTGATVAAGSVNCQLQSTVPAPVAPSRRFTVTVEAPASAVEAEKPNESRVATWRTPAAPAVLLAELAEPTAAADCTVHSPGGVASRAPRLD